MGRERTWSGALLQVCLFSKLDGTSTVVFVPYIGEKYAAQYMIPNYVGEALAAFVPGILSLIQTAGPSFDNSFSNRTNETVAERFERFQQVFESKLLFSVSAYMSLLGVLLCSCMLAFAWLVHAQRGKSERSKFKEQKRENAETSHRNEGMTMSEKSGAEARVDPSQDVVFRTFCSQRVETGLLAFLVLFIVFLVYGLLPSLQSYAVSWLVFPTPLPNASLNKFISPRFRRTATTRSPTPPT